jgi:hypothetical protein
MIAASLASRWAESGMFKVITCIFKNKENYP